MKRNLRGFLPVLLATGMLGGCISLTAKPPASLLMLSSEAGVAVNETRSTASSPSITIEVPSVPAALASQRIPVQTGETSIAYVKGALWSEPPARLFARVIADTVAAKTGRIVLTPAQSLLDPGARLSGELRHFGLDSASGDAVVTFDATLIRADSKAFEKRRFQARESVGSVAPENVGAALNRAANRIAGQVADWVGK